MKFSPRALGRHLLGGLASATLQAWVMVLCVALTLSVLRLLQMAWHWPQGLDVSGFDLWAVAVQGARFDLKVCAAAGLLLWPLLLAVALVRTYDVVLVMTSGGPGDASEVPAKFIIDHLFGRNNIGLASAASVVLLSVIAWSAVQFLVRYAGHRARWLDIASPLQCVVVAGVMVLAQPTHVHLAATVIYGVLALQALG